MGVTMEGKGFEGGEAWWENDTCQAPGQEQGPSDVGEQREAPGTPGQSQPLGPPVTSPPQNCMWPPHGSFGCTIQGTQAQKRDPLGHSSHVEPFPAEGSGGAGVAGGGGDGGGEGSTHMRTGLMAFLMLPKAARPSSSRRHLSASSAGFSFSFSGAWSGEGDRLWKQTAHD